MRSSSRRALAPDVFGHLIGGVNPDEVILLAFHDGINGVVAGKAEDFSIAGLMKEFEEHAFVLELAGDEAAVARLDVGHENGDVTGAVFGFHGIAGNGDGKTVFISAGGSGELRP